MKRLKQFKKEVKGFTLVEIIVVLLVLVILAAISIPTMMGYVEEARESEYIAQARTAYVAAQTVAIKKVAENPDFLLKKIGYKDIKKYLGKNSKVTNIQVKYGNVEVITEIVVTVLEKYEVTFKEDEAVSIKKIPQRP